MNITFLEPFLSGSHAKWAKAYQKYSSNDIQILGLKGKYWKWRMFGGAVSLAEQFHNQRELPDLILASDMLDFSTFLGLTRQKTASIPTAIYFHENQITYPWSPTDQDVTLKRNNQYGFINYTSALAADAIFFNSDFHLNSFTNSLSGFLKQFPDHQSLQNIEVIKNKSKVLHLGMELEDLNITKPISKPAEAVILWNHRWEYDKNPDSFFKALFRLKEEQISFKLIVTGASYARAPEIFKEAQQKLKREIIHFGMVHDFEQYKYYLHLADILPVSSNQDFFGGSVVEAIYCNCLPILPNRLAYPEHIPTEARKNHLYETEEAFYQLLKTAILEINPIRQSQYSNFVAQYDWSILASKYDLVFKETLEQAKNERNSIPK